jgi:uncharacterized membrane protein
VLPSLQRRPNPGHERAPIECGGPLKGTLSPLPPMLDPRRPSWSQTQRTLRAGLLVVTPLVITVSVLLWIFGLLDGVLGRSIRHWTHRAAPGLGLATLIVVIFLVGLIARSRPGRGAVLAIDRGLAALGLTSWIYSPATQLTQVGLGANRTMFNRTVLVRFPHHRSWVIGFVTTDAPAVIATALGDTALIGVFVPHAPNPTGGFLVFVGPLDYREVDLPVEAAFRLVVTGGAIAQHLDAADDQHHPLADLLTELETAP